LLLVLPSKLPPNNQNLPAASIQDAAVYRAAGTLVAAGTPSVPIPEAFP
jgi:hypothetical protein